MKFSFHRAFLFSAIPIPRNWATKLSSFAITFSTWLLLAQSAYAAVSPLTLNIQPDDYGSETTWKITDSSGTPIAEGGPYEDSNTTPIAETINLPIGTGYTFTIYDSYGDGLSSPGSYSLEDAESSIIASGGGDFGSEESTQFDITSAEFAITGTPITKLGPNQAYSFTPIVYGNDGSPLTFSINTKPAWANFDANTGALTGTPTDSDIGTTNGIEITVSNGTETATLTAFDITVVVNTPPTITGTPPTTAKVGWTYRFTPTANDADGDSLTFSITNKPDWAEFDASTGSLSGTPNEEGTTNIEISVSDEMAATAALTFDLTVINVNKPYVSSTTAVGKSPYAIAINHQTNQIYVANQNSDTVTVIDGYNTNLTTTIAVGDHPQAIAINPNTNKIYVANIFSHDVTVIDGNTLNTTTVAVGREPIALAINPKTNQIYVTSGKSNNVTMIDGKTLNTTTIAVEDISSENAIAINPNTNQIYVGHGDVVTVIDGNTLNTSTVMVGNSPSAIAINPKTNQIYVANMFSNDVTVIDGNTLNTTTIAVGDMPTTLAINVNTNQIYVANAGSSDNMTVIDGSTLNTTTVAVGSDPSSLAINSQTNQVYVNCQYNTFDPGTNITVIDGNTLNTTTVAMEECPISLAINPQTNQIYAANNNSVTIIDGSTNQNITIIDVEGYPEVLAINEQTNKIYTANREINNVTVIDGNTNQKTTIDVGKLPDAIAINEQTNKIYVVNGGGDNVTVIDGNTLNTTTIAVGEEPKVIAINPNTNKIYVANSWNNNVTVIDGDMLNTTTVAVEEWPDTIAINEQTNKIYVANPWNDNVTVIDGNTLDTTTVTVGDGPTAIAINPQTNKIYVANGNSGNMTIIDGSNLNTTTVVVGNAPIGLAINLKTNQIYVANKWSDNVTIIDGNTLHTKTIAVGNTPMAIAINQNTNKIYVANYLSDNVTLINGNTNQTTTITIDVDEPTFQADKRAAIAINPYTNQIYVVNNNNDYATDNNKITVITPWETTHPNPLPVEIIALPDDTSFSSPTFSFNATGDIAQVYYQTPMGTDKTWHRATFTGGQWQGTTPPLPRGGQFLRAFATDEIMEATLNNATGTNSPFIGEISSYFFTVVTSPILLDNSGNPYLTEITEDIDPAKNTGTLLADMLATGALGDPITDGDYDAVEGIAVVAVDNTNGRWEYSIDNGTTWVAFGTPSNTNARLLADKPQTRIRFQPNSNFNGTVESGITFHAWDQSFGDNGGLFDLTDSQLDPYTFSPKTETASITIGDAFEQFTGLYLETSAVTILNSDTLDIAGKLSVYPMTGQDLSGQEILVTITAPDGITRVEKTLTTNTDIGQFEWKGVSLPGLFNPMQKGPFGFQAKFAGSAVLAASQSATEAVLVGSSAGYAILVQGKIKNAEGLAAHNKSIHRIYKKFKERGFDDGNIKYFNYNTKQPGVDGLPIKSDIAAAFTELQDRMNSNPAPFYIIMIDHGGIDGTFHIYGGNNNENDVITPTDVNLWLNSLEDELSDTAIQEPRLVMLGACYSGSFIPELSKAGRTIITSATAQEESYKGPEEPDGIRSGEFFMEEFFTRLGRSDNIKAAFEFATTKTEAFTRRGDGNRANRFYDEATQHPLLDDNGDGQGSNTLTAAMNSDGHAAETILLGVGLNYKTNSALNPAEILHVNHTIYLNAYESAATLEMMVNNANYVNSAPVDIRKPSVILNSSGAETSEQLEITNLPRRFMSCSSTNLCVADFEQFIEPGMYEAFYFVRDNETNDISPIRRSVIYKNYANNPSPSVFDLVEPLDDSEHKTTLMFKWDSSSDSNGPVTYNFIVATDESFNDIVYQQEELEIAMTYVDDAVGLEDQTTYYWKVEAVDPFGERTTSSSVFSLTTNNTNAPPSIGSIFVSSALDFTSVNNATITFPNDTNINPDIYTDQGQYNMLLPPGRRRVRVEVDGYEPREIDLDTTGGTTGLNVELIPDGGLPTQPGLLQFAATTASVDENEGTITILVERVEGSDGAISVDYATAKNSATSDSDYTSISGTLNWKDKEERAKAIYLSILDDQEFEGDETLTITLSNPTGDATLGTQNPITVTIVDDEAAPPPEPGTVQFSSNTYSAEEGDSTVNITVSRTKGSEGLISVQYLVNGTAFLGKDYTGGSGSITWSDGDDADKTLNLKILDDDEVEDTETLTLTLFSPTGEASLGSRDTATLTITDNDVATSAGTLQFKTATQTVNEGEEITLTVTRTNGTDGEVSVQYMTTGESTASSSDYTGSNGELTWANGEDDSQSFTIKIVDDEDVEETESIQFTLLSPTGEATLGSPAQATVNITDNDEAKASALDSNTNAEVLDSENAKADALNSENFKTDALNSENAKADALNSENLKADALNSESPVLESNAPALESESNASALESESNASALESEFNASALESESKAEALKTAESKAEALDTVQFATTIYNAQEGENVTLTVERTGSSQGEISVQTIVTGASTATFGDDYTGGNGSLSWPDGDTQPKTFTITLVDDEEPESSETVGLMLVNPTGPVELGPLSQATVIIKDNDDTAKAEALDSTALDSTPEETTGTGILQFMVPFYTINEGMGLVTTFTVTRTGGSEGEVSVRYTSTDSGTALANQDYLGATGQLTWADGDNTPKSISLMILDDQEIEESETIPLILFEPAGGATLGATTQAALLIADNDTLDTDQSEEKEVQETAEVSQAAPETEVNEESSLTTEPSVEETEIKEESQLEEPETVEESQPEDETASNADETAEPVVETQTLANRLNEISTLPNLGRGTAVANDGTIVTAKILKDSFNVAAIFRGGASSNGQDYQSTLTLSTKPTQMVRIVGDIEIDTAHQGQTADILIVAGLLDEIQDVISAFFMLNTQDQIEVWDGNLATLMAVQEKVTLGPTQQIEIYHGLNPQVPLNIFFGYRLDNGLILFNGEQPIELKVEPNDVRTQPITWFADFSPDGEQIVTTGSDGAVNLWDTQTGHRLIRLRRHTDVVKWADFSPDGLQLVTTSLDKTVRVWDMDFQDEIQQLIGHQGLVESATFCPSGNLIVTASQDGTARVWELETNQLLGILKGHQGAVTSATFNADGTQIVTTSTDGTAHLWTVPSLEKWGTKGISISKLAVLKHDGIVEHADFSPDGNLVVTASWDGTARVWNVDSGEEISVLKHQNGVPYATFSPDGSLIVTTSWDKTARIWETPLKRKNATNALNAILIGHQGVVNHAAFSPDGLRLVTTSSDNTARVWEVETGHPLLILKGHTNTVWKATFSPDGERIITASWDNTARVWDANTGELLMIFRD
jgi:YVTN family beta-propeller protein